MVTTQNPITGLSGISNTKKKTSLDIPSAISSNLSLANIKSSTTVPIAALSSQLKSGNASNKKSYCKSSFSGTSESDSDQESCQNTINKTKSAFFKAKKKEKLRIRFEVEETVHCQWDPGPYAKSSGDSGLTSSSSSSIALNKHSSSGGSGLCSNNNNNNINDFGYNSQTLLSKKPKRTKSLKKLLTKSRSFVGSSSASSSKDSISRAELVAKYHNQHHQPKSDVVNIINSQSTKSSLLPQLQQCVKDKDNKKLGEWGIRDHLVKPDSSNRVTVSGHGLSFCKNCGSTSSSDQYQSQKLLYGKFLEHPVQKSWLGMAPRDIHFHGRYSRLPSSDYQEHQLHVDNRNNFHSLKYDKVHLHKQLEKKEEDEEEGQRNFYKYNKGFYKSRNKEYGIQDTTFSREFEMALHQDRLSGSESQEQYDSYYDCRIPRPKLKFVVPTHSYGVSSKSKLRRRPEVDASGFSEISLSDGNEDGAYASGSGCSSRVRSEHSGDDTISEFEREQEQIAIHDERDYVTQVERIHSTEENSPLGHFPSDYTALYSCEKGIVLKGNPTRRLLSFKKPHLPSLLSKSSSKTKSPKCGEHTEFLKSLPIFRKLSNGFLTKLCDHITEASYECGEYILRQGSRGEGLFILTSGTAKANFQSKFNLNGDCEGAIYLRTLHPGDMFGEKSIQGEKINMMNIIANEESVSCIIISEDGFEQLMAKSLEFRQRFSDKSQRTNVDGDFERIELEDLRLISTLGIGGFGRVELVTLASNPNRSFALKQMKKCQIVATRQVEHIKSEKAILMETKCDFITKLYKTYKDAKYLYMLMECCLGGELWTILRDRGHFDDQTVRFYVGCVLEAIKYLHSRNIIYRDLKPENLLLDAKGYLKLVDFGFAKKLEGNKTWTFCGTPEYVAPEIILNKGHDITADYWSLGVLMYELLTGTPPFVGGDPMRTYKLILKGIDYIDFPQTVSKNAYNLIRKLCRENPLDRLGSQRGGLSDIKKHKWFDGLEWNALRSKTLTPPIIPYVRGPHDCGNFDEYPPDRSGTPPDDLNGWDWDF